MPNTADMAELEEIAETFGCLITWHSADDVCELQGRPLSAIGRRG